MTACLTFLAVLLVFAAPTVAAPTLYVSPEGNDGWTGRHRAPSIDRTDGPFRTIERARDAIRQMKQSGTFPSDGVTVELGAGTHELARPVELTEADSGLASGPVSYQAERSAEVRIVGGKVLGGFKPVTDPAILERLDPAARGKVVVANLPSQGVHDLAGVRATGQWAQSVEGISLTFADRPMTLARWPNEGFVKIADVLNREPYDIRGTWGDKFGAIVYEGDRPSRWTAEKEVWLHGYWFWDWADERQKVDSIDTVKRVMTFAKPHHSYGYRKGQWYYAFNLLCEIDQPGEWYLDRETGNLYFWPPSAVEQGRPTVSILPSLFVLKRASHVTLRGLSLEAARGAAIVVEGGEGVRVVGCTIRNCGGWAVNMTNARESGVAGCDIYHMGEGGISLSGGDRRTLTPSGLYADNNHIHHFARWNPVYKPGVLIDGVGCRITHNLIHNAPHMAIGFGGNDHLIEFNEIHSVCYQSNDAGAIYAGRNWTTRGTIIRHNYLHDISGFRGEGCVGVYLDDQWSGTRIEGNVFWKVSRAAMIGGGRDCTIENNIFVDCVPATHVDARGLGWAASGFDDLKQKLEAVPYREPPWSTRYPQLPGILSDDPMAPKGNLIARNICVGGRWGDFEERAKPMVTFVDNLLDQDPQFVNASAGDFRLKESSPAWKLGFRPIPIERIGVYNSPDRASWPVEHAVRPR